MATAQIEVLDIGAAPETFAAGGAAVSVYGVGLIQITFVNFRHDVEAGIIGRPREPSKLVIVGRLLIENKAALALAESLRQQVTESQNLAARVLPDDQGGRA